jgi:DNA-binding NarL/FixJ family response regulator
LPAIEPVLGLVAVAEEAQARVAELVGEGLTNKQIGAPLVIAEQTVKRQVRESLANLELANRMQLARWVLTR